MNKINHKLIIICLFLNACKPNSIRLFENFYSYDTVESIKKSNKLLPFIEILKNDTGISILQIDNYVDLGQEGKLELLFCKNQLTFASFFPKDTIKYLHHLKTMRKMDLIKNKVISFDNLEVLKSYESDIFRKVNGFFVSYTDKRLVKILENTVW